MRKNACYRLKESTIHDIKKIADEYDISQAEVIETIINFLVLCNEVHNTSIEQWQANQKYITYIENLYQTLK